MKPNCYECKWRRAVPGDAHSACAHPEPVRAVGAMHGIMRGWWIWPDNFDPVWLVSCDGFEREAAVNKTTAAPDDEPPYLGGGMMPIPTLDEPVAAPPFAGGGGTFGGAGASGSWDTPQTSTESPAESPSIGSCTADSGSSDSGSSGGDSGGGSGGSE